MGETLTTAVRIESILESNLHLIPLIVGVDNDSADIGGMAEAAQTIAAEIDVLTAQRDEARAEVERLRPAAEAWDKSEAYDTILLCQQPDADWDIRLRRAYNIRGAARARARAAKGAA